MLGWRLVDTMWNIYDKLLVTYNELLWVKIQSCLVEVVEE